LQSGDRPDGKFEVTLFDGRIDKFEDRHSEPDG